MKKKQYLLHIHYFRAFAIISIVFVHTLGIPVEYKTCSSIQMMLIGGVREIFFHASTFFFIFISGFLFYYTKKEPFNTNRFYKNKFLNLIIPFMFFSLIYLTFNFFSQNNLNSIGLNTISIYLNSLIHGNASYHLWYLPFITIVFLISPIFLRIPINILTRITLFSIILPLLGTRTGSSVSIFQFIYFFPVFLLGMICAVDYGKVMQLIKNNLYILIITTIISTIGIVITDERINLSIIPYSYGIIKFNESFYFMQKCALIFLVLHFLLKFENSHNKLIDSIARFSFGIYFIHILVQQLLPKKMVFDLFIPFSTNLIVPIAFLYSFLILFTSLILCILISFALGKYSRYIIGYN